MSKNSNSFEYRRISPQYSEAKALTYAVCAICVPKPVVKGEHQGKVPADG